MSSASEIPKSVEKNSCDKRKCLFVLFIYSCFVWLLAVYLSNYVDIVKYLTEKPVSWRKEIISDAAEAASMKKRASQQYQNMEHLQVREDSLPNHDAIRASSHAHEQSSSSYNNAGPGGNYQANLKGCQPIVLDPFKVPMPRRNDLQQQSAFENNRSCGDKQSRIVVRDSTIYVNMEDPHSACFFSEIFWAGDYAIVNSIKQWVSTKFTPGLSDFVQANCIDYKTGHSYETAVPVPTRLSPRLLKFRGWQWLPDEALPVNILIVGLSRASSNRFIREYPNTKQYLSNELKAVHFPGYNVLGRGPVENFLPLLTGVRSPPTSGNQGIFKLYTDEVYPIILRTFERFGYITALIDDLLGNSPSRGHERGFRKKPADHYSRPLQMIRKFVSPMGSGCIDNKTSASTILEYTNKLWDLYPDHPKFFMTMLGQNCSDAELRQFFERFSSKSLDESNTILVVLSDEGYRYKEEPLAQVRQEENNPILYIRVPQEVEKFWPQAVQNAKKNARYLITPLDVHATLQSLLTFKSFDGNCENLGIPEKFCSCHEHHQVEYTNEETLVEYANRSVDAINAIVRQEMIVFERHMLQSNAAQYLDMCVPWKFKAVTRASKYSRGSTSGTMLQIVVEVQPARHFFEVNVAEGSFNQSLMPSESGDELLRPALPYAGYLWPNSTGHMKEMHTLLTSRNDVELLGCCIPRELQLLRELCYCNMEVSSIRKACEAIKSD